MTDMSKMELKEIVEEAAKVAVRETFLRLGLATNEDHDILAIQNDMAWLRKQRKATERVSQWVHHGAITITLSGLLWLIWEGLKLAMVK